MVCNTLLMELYLAIRTYLSVKVVICYAFTKQSPFKGNINIITYYSCNIELETFCNIKKAAIS